MENLLRQLAMLQQIPRYPRRVDTGAIKERLARRGYAVSLRTIQRDLNSLASVLPLAADNSKPQGWSWAADAMVVSFPGLDPQTALVFQMVEAHMRALLPPATVEMLIPWFQAARGVLAEAGRELGAWPDKVRVLPRGMPLLPPKIDPTVQETVYRGLLEDRRMQVTYRAKGATEARTYQISPLAIVQRGHLTYVVATLGERQKPVMLLLHRIAMATLQEGPLNRPKGFDLDRFIGEGELNYRVGEPIRLRVKFEKEAGAFLYETPLSEDQAITATDMEHLEVTATVPDTNELRGWLRGFGKVVDVLEPAGLLD